jgi:cation transport regulator ChaC
MNKKMYFAYGSCTNVESFRETLKQVDCEDQFRICGVGILIDYKLAFTRRSKKWNGGVLDIIKSSGDYVLGVVYEIPEEAISAIDKREGASCYYRKIDNIEVELGFDKVNVFTYEVIEKQEDEIAPTMNYFNTVYTGMKNRFPTEYIDKYLIGHCNDKFNMHIVNAQQNTLYHHYDKQSTEFMRDNPELYNVLKQMALFFGDDNEKVETVQPTPEMFRLLVKCTELAARGKLDFGHMIPRGIYNRLASEFQRISGIRVEHI